MCKFLGHIVKLIASVSMRRHYHHRGDAGSGSGSGSGSHTYRDAPPASANVARASRESRPESLSSTRGATYQTSHGINGPLPNRALSEPDVPRDAREQVHVEQYSLKRSMTSLAKDHESMYSKEGEGSKTRNEPRPPKENYQYRYDEKRPDDSQDIPRGVRYSSEKEIVGIHPPPPVHSKDLQPMVPPPANFQHRFEAQSRELSILQHECRVALEEKKALTDAYAVLRQQYDERYKKLNVARHERQTAIAQRKEVDDAYMALKQQYNEQTRKLNTVRQEHETVLEQKQKAEEDYTTLRQKYETQKNEYNALSSKYQSLKAVLEQRTSELQGVQKFLTTADTFSGSEVVNMLRKLNEEVQQSMTFMAEWAVENFAFEAPPMDQMIGQNVEQTRTLETLGMRFMQLLGTKNHKENPILLEMAFRAYLVYELYWVASPWSVGQEEQAHNAYVDAIYQRIREAEGQAVSGNWRALTRAHTLPACVSDPEIAHTFDTTVVTGFTDILLAAGCTASRDDILSELWSQFAEKVHYFVSLAGQVNKIIGVGVISEDFEVLVIWPDAVFEEATMEDAYDNGERGGEREEYVLCATELGLLQRMSVCSAQKGKPAELIVTKPKVALLSVFDVIT